MDLGFGDVTWRCHLCGQERPDDKISVYQRDLVVDGKVIGKQNIRYCNDNADCVGEVVYYDHLAPLKRRS